MIEALINFIQSVLAALTNRRPPSLGVPTRIDDIDHIKKWEALRLEAYKPTPHDVWTIGWGHTKLAREGMVITQDQAESLLRDDLAWVENAIARYVKVPLSQKQYDALAGLIFNIGATNFSKSTVLKRLNEGDYRGAADAFLMWNKQRQNGQLVVLKGLQNRRKEERRLFLDGTET